MKLLLTSAGITNNSIKGALLDLNSKPFSESKIAFVPTGANVEEGDKGWVIEDLVNFQKLGFKSLDIVDISALPRGKWEKRLKTADVIVLGGGNTFYLMHWVKQSGLQDLLPKFLETKVYVGISAGSCITGPEVDTSFQSLFPDEPNEYNVKEGLNLVPFYVLPHLNSEYFTELRENRINELTQTATGKVYALDDQSAVVVVDAKVEVVSEGTYIKDK